MFRRWHLVGANLVGSAPYRRAQSVLVLSMVAIVVTLVFAPAASHADAPWTDIPIANPGAETGDLTGWGAIGKACTRAPHTGDYYFCNVRAPFPSQALSLAALAPLIDQQRVVASTSVWLAYGHFKSAFRTAAGNELEPLLFQYSGYAWREFGHSGVVPVGARFLVLGATGYSTVFDDVSARYCVLPAMPDLRAPHDLKRASLTPLFLWGAVPDISEYQIQIAYDADFERVVLDRFVPDNVTRYLMEFALDGNTRYFWRVRGNNECGDGIWSPTQSFFTRPFRLDSFTLSDLDSGSARFTSARTVALRLTENGTASAYYVSERGATPSPDARGWTASIPRTFTLSPRDGRKTAYAWAKDDGGAISSRARATITLDTGRPNVELSIPSRTSSRTITIALRGSDASGIGGWYVSESPSRPPDSAWSRTKPRSFTLSPAEGRKTIYAWVLDFAGNSAQAAASVTYELPARSLRPIEFMVDTDGDGRPDERVGHVIEDHFPTNLFLLFEYQNMRPGDQFRSEWYRFEELVRRSSPYSWDLGASGRATTGFWAPSGEVLGFGYWRVDGYVNGEKVFMDTVRIGAWSARPPGAEYAEPAGPPIVTSPEVILLEPDHGGRHIR